MRLRDWLALLTKPIGVVVRERKHSRFTPGALAVGFMSLAAIAAVLLRTEFWTDWLNHWLHTLGYGTVARPTLMWVSAIPVLFAACAAALLSQSNKRKLQYVRDADLTMNRPHVLFLRPFFTDTRLAVPNPYYSVWSAGLGRDGTTLLPEEFVGRVLEPYIDVRQVGGATATIGNSRISVSSAEWRATVAQAIEEASAILVLPVTGHDKATGKALGDGTLWELAYLVNSGYITRSIILMPPSVLLFRRKSTRLGWEHTRAEASRFGLTLPPYDTAGRIMRVVAVDEGYSAVSTCDKRTNGRKRLAIDLVAALQELSRLYNFKLLDR